MCGIIFTVAPSIVAMCFSLLSLLKTSYDLQEVDRQEKAVSTPLSLLLHVTTSLSWFASTVIFRTLSLSAATLYLSQYVDIRGLAIVPVALLFVGNICIR